MIEKTHYIMCNNIWKDKTCKRTRTCIHCHRTLFFSS